MQKPNNKLTLSVGNVSSKAVLGKYYQDFSDAMYHFENNSFGDFDQDELPMSGFGKNAVYHQVYIIQYGLILHDFILGGINEERNRRILKKCITWLEKNEEEIESYTVWRNKFNIARYGLKKGWVSGMYQGQIISLYLRYGQLIGEENKYIEKSQRVYNFFDVDYENGGVKRYDSQMNLWFEEYPSSKPSFVLNGFIYAFFGVYDLWRVTKSDRVNKTAEACISTLVNSIHLYDSGYWSIYDQLKKELATKYYHKNIHIPLMSILFELTNEEVFLHYKNKWQKQLDSKLNTILVALMYRIQPRLRKFQKL